MNIASEQPKKYRVLDRTNWQSVRNRKTYLSKSGRPLAHLVWEEEHGPIPPDHNIHHVDRNPENNNIENLQLVTHQEHHRIHSGNYYYDKNLNVWLKRCSGCGRFMPADDGTHYSKTQNGSGRDIVRARCKQCRAKKTTSKGVRQ